MLEIIARLVALKYTLKLYHWNIEGQTFNADHPYLDEIEEPIDDFIDKLVEKYFMATNRNDLPKLFDAIMLDSSKYFGPYEKNPEEIFKQIKNLIAQLHDKIEDIDTYRGVNAVLDEISSHLLTSLGLINGRLS